MEQIFVQSILDIKARKLLTRLELDKGFMKKEGGRHGSETRLAPGCTSWWSLELCLMSLSSVVTPPPCANTGTRQKAGEELTKGCEMVTVIRDGFLGKQ